MPRATITSRRDAGGGLVLVELDVDDVTARAYTSPGQYVEVRAPRETGYFVLAGAIGRRPWELLVRNTGEAADLLVTRALGVELEVSTPMGRGFPCDQLHGRPLIVAVVASAIGVARALLAVRIAEGHAASTSLLVGVRSAVEVPIADEVVGWMDAGVPVTLCLSRSELEHHREALPRASRAAGYVQTVLRGMLQTGVPPDLVVAAAGPEGMLADLRTLGAETHVEVLTNVT